MAEQYLQQNQNVGEAWDQLASENQQTEIEDIDNQPVVADAGIEESDIARELGLPVSQAEEDLHSYNEMCD
jgi:hypothetical protein